MPPSPEGAAKLQAFFAAYLGKPAAGQPAAISVTPEAPDYAVALDLAAMAAPAKALGFAFDPAKIVYQAHRAGRRTWRVENSGFPTLAAHIHAEKNGAAVEGAETITVANAVGQALIDPAIGFWRSLAFDRRQPADPGQIPRRRRKHPVRRDEGQRNRPGRRPTAPCRATINQTLARLDLKVLRRSESDEGGQGRRRRTRRRIRNPLR